MMKKIGVPLLTIANVGFIIYFFIILPKALQGGFNSFYGKEAVNIFLIIIFIIIDIVWLLRRKK